MGHSVFGAGTPTSSDEDPRGAHPRQSKHPPGRRKMVGFDVQRLHDQPVTGVVHKRRGLLRPSATPPFLNTITPRQLHMNGVTPTMFSNLVNILHKKQGVMVLHNGSGQIVATPIDTATDRSFFGSVPPSTSKFPFDRKVHLQQQQTHFMPIFPSSPTFPTSSHLSQGAPFPTTSSSNPFTTSGSNPFTSSGSNSPSFHSGCREDFRQIVYFT